MTFEGYVQESGRSGHNGEPAVVVLYYGKKDEFSAQLSGKMKHYFQTKYADETY